MDSRNETKTIVGIVALIALGVVGWLGLREPEATPAAIPEATPVAARTTTDETPTAELSAPERVVQRTAADTPAEPALSATETESSAVASSVRLFGVVKPAEGRNALKVAQNLRVVDRSANETLTETDADGNYSVPGLAPGRYWISIRSPEDGNAHAVVDLDGKSAEQRVDLQLVLPPEIWVRVVDEAARPLGDLGFLAVATREPAGDWIDEVHGSFNNPFGVGQFWQSGYTGPELPEGFIGRVLLDVEPPVHIHLLRYQRVLATRRVERGEKEVEFVIPSDSKLLRSGTLRFRFVDRLTSAPIERASVTLASAGARMLAPKTGEIVASNLQPGMYELQLRTPGYERCDLRVRVEAGEELQLGDVLVDRESFVSGRVVDTEGSGVASALSLVRIDPATGRPLATLIGQSFQTAADGSFRIGRLSRAAYELRVGGGAESGWGTCTQLVDATNGSVDDVRIELRAGVPLIVSPSDDRWREVRFRVTDSEGKLVHSGRLWAEAPQRVMLARGSYSLEVTLGDAEPRVTSIDIADEPVSMSIP